MRLATLFAKATTGDAAALPAATVLRCATLAGAQALGLGDIVGSLLPGKAADIVAVDLSTTATLPCYDPISHLVNAAGREHVTDVWIDGVRVVEAHRPLRIEAAALRASVDGWQARLAPMHAHRH
jgi:5-methylthioadenosine/S-adenosylhomocysteine deaminase